MAFVTALAVSVTGLLWAGQTLNQVEIAGIRGVTDVHMRLEGSAWVLWYNATASPNVTAFAFLREAADARGLNVTWSEWAPPLSAVFVESIAGDVNGAGGRYWQFWVDGRYANVGADHAVLHDGAFVEWRFVSAQEACC